MGGRGAGLGAAARCWLRWGDVDGRAGLGLGCGRLLFDSREVDAATLPERKNKRVRKVKRCLFGSSIQFNSVLFV